MFCILKRKNTVYPAYVSKHNRIREKQVILLMIPNGERWHYLTVKKLSALLRGITSQHHDDFFCLKCLDSLSTEKNLNCIKTYVNIKTIVTL